MKTDKLCELPKLTSRWKAWGSSHIRGGEKNLRRIRKDYRSGRRKVVPFEDLTDRAESEVLPGCLVKPETFVFYGEG